ncbi:U6 small nuclear RNA (adenine-(43)-N(6))-methyltransferase [Pararge aegeria]|uniref:U6 small nuclear RNA (adenine-(43)-N(6))-methyltransferase n=2 Tax=Pararge aegeria TaxID=116150 RepID=A0A8S4SE70_9NEOP|nr:U6 small nuclear RNA (adenine-(43)-N(6))-methyltransferase [Pararge aegeria]CAH2262822.1 jg9196 [Pararge aegeria aegeria]
MALNKFMHPRNIYKTPPDFAKLAKTNEEFSGVAKVDISGKVSIDFKNPHSLRVLTKCLLKTDFNLDVVIPEDRLVPTLPLRLNYILWIEDLISTINKSEPILGLDIGTGACAIYPLLAAVKNKWHMVGTETDAESLKQARDNIIRNNLQHLIEIRENTTELVIENMFMDENSQTFDFCMCNPPFYTNMQELWESRSPARPEPKNGFTGSPHELITEGGELQFCRKILEESKLHKDKILIFTTMVGHKFNLKELVIDLKAVGITYTTTEFCQGRVTRWGLAWTYQNYDFSTIYSPKDKLPKKRAPILFSLPELKDCSDNIEKLKRILENLQISHKVITKRKTDLMLDVIAFSNTWSNQRRKRRILKRLSEDPVKKARLNLKNQSDESSEKEKEEISKSNETIVTKSIERAEENTSNNVSYNNSIEKHKEAVVHALMKIFKKDELVNIEMEFINGSAGKEGLHQIVQYIKNNWK